ncbi:MAG: MscL family protein [Nanoarchaeota archaeon]
MPNRIFLDFSEFLKEYKIVGLAVAFVIGTAASVLVKSLVDNIIMPLITPFIPNGAWQTATFSMGPIVIGWGPFLSALINFTIIAITVFLVARHFIKKEKEAQTKKK